MQTRVMGAAAALVMLAGTAAAQNRVEERRPAAPDGLVQISNPTGSTRVVGWERSEVLVTGTLGPGADGLTFETAPGRTEIGIDSAGDPHRTSAELEVRVPAGSRLEVESLNASIDVSGIKGSVHADTVQGRIVVADATGEVMAEAVNGSVEVSGSPRRVEAESVNGSVTVSGASGEVKASTVNGRLLVSGGSFHRVTLETVNGRIVFDGELRGDAVLDVESVGGTVELRLPENTSAAFTVATFSGEVRNELGPSARSTSRWTSEKELSFTLGSARAKVGVETLSGDVEIRKKTGGRSE